MAQLRRLALLVGTHQGAVGGDVGLQALTMRDLGKHQDSVWGPALLTSTEQSVVCSDVGRLLCVLALLAGADHGVVRDEFGPQASVQ